MPPLATIETRVRDQRIHRTLSEDGTQIAGRVHGHGPPVVLVHGALDDGEVDFGSLLPRMSQRFTCYVPSTRGRGLSGDSPDHSVERLVEDVSGFAKSVGEPVGLFGLSGGGMFSLAAAACTLEVSAVAVYEPPVFEVISEEEGARFRETLGRMDVASAEGRPFAAARTFFDLVATGTERAALSSSGGVEACARYLPVDLQEFRAVHSGGFSPTDPSILRRITVPVLLLHGSRTALPWFTAGIRHLADHLPDAEVCELEGAGHFGPVVEGRAVADELIRFFERKPGAAGAP